MILEVSGHAGVWDLIASVKAQLDRVRYLSLEEQAWLTMIFRQHREIVAAIAAHDPTGAESAMQRHLRTAFAAIERIASAHAEFFEEEAPELVSRFRSSPDLAARPDANFGIEGH